MGVSAAVRPHAMLRSAEDRRCRLAAMLIGTLALVPLGALAQIPSFAPVVNVPLGPNPHSLVPWTFNNDGHVAFRLKGRGAPMAAIQDANGVNKPDPAIRSSTEPLQITGSDSLAMLHGKTSGDVFIIGSDSIGVVPRAMWTWRT